MNLEKKSLNLARILQDMESVLVAFSGGVDSTFLTAIARQELGKEKVLAVTGRSETYSSAEYKESIDLAKQMDVCHLIIDTKELSNKDFSENRANRCYHCKTELFGKLRKIADIEKINYVVDGSNVDDESDYRPGRQAAEDHGVRSPLLESGIGKDEIRRLSKQIGLKSWDKPQMACLASRFPYGSELTEAKLKRVEQAEDFLKNIGFKHVRVRDYDSTARIEVPKNSIKKLIDQTPVLVEKLKSLGYVYITIDVEGFRTGSMNEVLTISR